MSDNRVIVVGTTGDYIRLIHDNFPGRAVFLTDNDERRKWGKVIPDDAASVMWGDLSEHDGAIATVERHIAEHKYKPSGIACYDCESMLLASRIARRLKLDYPSQEAIANARNKFLAKQLWQKNRVACPRMAPVRNIAEAVEFLDKIGRPIVLKPLTGSGSELVFMCESKIDCFRAFKQMTSSLVEHHNARMYTTVAGDDGQVNPREVFDAEEFIRGREYSCDFIIDGKKVEIIRIARKFAAHGEPLGTIMAYLLPANVPQGIDGKKLKKQLGAAAHALGIRRAIVMVDFMVKGDVAYLLEMTPRPGGDCLPELIKQSSGFDIIGASLDFASGKKVHIPDAKKWQQLVGLRLFAQRPGIIKNIDLSGIKSDPRVLGAGLKVKEGHEVILPPENYDSRILGHVIFRPANLRRIEDECRDIAGKLLLETEAAPWAIPSM